MKHFFLKGIVLVGLMFISPEICSAVTFEVDNLSYEVVWEENGYGAVSVADCRDISGNIEIPASVSYNEVQYAVTSIGAGAFGFCSGLTGITIPESVTSIGSGAFSNCTNLNSITIPESVTTLGDWAFMSCESLKSAAIGNSVTSIGQEMFDHCTSLTSVEIGRSVSSIGYHAFWYCRNLADIIVSEDNYHYCSIDGVLYSKDVTRLIQCGGAQTSVTIPESVMYIDHSAFSYCDGLTSIIIPNSVTQIGSWAFLGCSNLAALTIGESVTSIGEEAFNGCVNLTSVVIPDLVTYIYQMAFAFCDKLSSVTIGSSVLSVGAGAFSDCNNITDVHCRAINPPSAVPYSFLTSTYQNAKLYVPKGTKNDYENTDPWKRFLSIEEFDLSGIGSVRADNEGVSVNVNGNTLIIEGIGCGEPIMVYDVQGRAIHSGESHVISSLPGGVYIVQVMDRIFKVKI